MEKSATSSKSFTPKVLSKREQKKRINIPSNSTRNFQFGLIISLLLALLVSESRISVPQTTAIVSSGIDLEEVRTIGKIIVESESKPKATIAKKSVVRKPIPLVFDPEKIRTTPVEAEPTPTPSSGGLEVPVAATPNALTVVGEPDPDPPGPETINSVEFVPVFPGCERYGTNKEKVDCMSSKMSTFIRRHFNTDVAEGESGRRERIYVQFKIDATGEIVDIKTRASERSLEKEATRVIDKLPTMKPGRQGNKNVSVLYMVPIVFEIE